jgi:hypothetical protein
MEFGGGATGFSRQRWTGVEATLAQCMVIRSEERRNWGKHRCGEVSGCSRWPFIGWSGRRRAVRWPASGAPSSRALREGENGEGESSGERFGRGRVGGEAAARFRFSRHEAKASEGTKWRRQSGIWEAAAQLGLEEDDWVHGPELGQKAEWAGFKTWAGAK